MKAQFYKNVVLSPTGLLIQCSRNINIVNELNNKLMNDLQNVLNEYGKNILEVCNSESDLINNQIKNN